MNIKDVRIGMKVVPTKKTVPEYSGLSNSHEWQKAKEFHPEHPFLYVIQNLDKRRESYEDDMPAHVVVLSARRKYSMSGDYFFPEDFKPYEQPTK